MWASSWGQIYRSLKSKFQDMSAAKAQYRHGCTVSSLVDKGNNVEVHFTNENGQVETAEAELVVGADGISSTVRQILLPECKRTYAGYAIGRGGLRASEVSPATLAVHDKFAVFGHNRNSQVISYWVPNSEGPVSESDRFFNWGWYSNLSEDELEEFMTDISGSRRAFTVPQGALREEIADRVRTKANEELPRLFAEPIEKTKQPFVQVITDSLASENVFFNGKVVLIGDAFAGQRYDFPCLSLFRQLTLLDRMPHRPVPNVPFTV